MNVWQNLDGSVAVELTSADVPGALAAIQAAGVYIWNVEASDPLTLRFHIRRRDHKKLEAQCKKRGEQLQLRSRNGLYWKLKGLKKRPILVIGLTLLLLFTLWVPGRVFFVQVVGNSAIPSRQIAEVAAKCGICFGADRREVRSEKMKNALLEAMPQLSWAGVNTYGCTAVITVQERAPDISETEVNSVSSIVASRDGIIRQLTVLRGNSLCTIGQAVKAGQVLISGYTDCGICIQAQAAQGEVFAETSRDFAAICPAVYSVRGAQTGKTQKISLIIGKKRINFANSSGNSGTVCAKIYKENYITLPGGFVLPVAIAVETWTYYETEQQQYTDAENLLQEFARSYVTAQMCAGSILRAAQAVTQLEGLWQLTGSYGCYEMIGITRIEENLPDYVKNH